MRLRRDSETIEDGLVMQPAVKFENEELILLDQTKLPQESTFLRCTTWQQVCDAIKTMVVRGAPAIGVAAAYGMVLAARAGRNEIETAAQALKSARPTAVNLGWAVEKMLRAAAMSGEDFVQTLYETALEIAEEDLQMCKAIGKAGLPLVPHHGVVMTHCNAGALATAGYGTALGVIRTAHEAGKRVRVIACETRPLLQGARLTTWELLEDGIPVTLITDNMAGHVMNTHKVNCVIVGADRIARNGDTANKIGTYALSVMAGYHGIPFYVAAPGSTIDVSLPSGDSIPIEQRDKREVTEILGVKLAPERVEVLNPAFDVTPHKNITAIITDRGLIYPPYEDALVAVAKSV